MINMYEPQSARLDTEKVWFYDKVVSEWDLRRSSEIILYLGDFKEHVGKCADSFKGVHVGNGIGKRNVDGRRLLEFCDETIFT